jgi:trehalose/maltose transport system permease protein
MTRNWTYYASRVLFYIILAVIFIYIVFPFYWAFRSSVTPNAELFVTPVHYWPDNPTLEHYQEVFTNSDFLVAMRNSTIVAASTTLLALFLGTVGAYALGRFKFGAGCGSVLILS